MSAHPASSFVSVIIPTHNRAWSLGAAVDSVLAQKSCAFELIVVDDGSTDDTPDLLRSYANRITVLRQENRGVSAARNTGLRHASGALIAFLDSDDRWLPEKLCRQTAFFERRPEALICQTQELWIRNGVRVNPGKRHQKRSGMIFEPSLHLCLVSPSAVMMRKALFEAVGRFDETLPACEDYDLWLRVSCRFPVFLVDEPLVARYGGHPDQLSSAPGLDRYRIAALVKCIETEPLSPRQRSAAMAVLSDKCRIYAEGCRKRGRNDEASFYLALPHQHHPGG